MGRGAGPACPRVLYELPAQNRTAARQLQNIRLGSGEANLLNGSRNLRADGDGCIEFAPDAGVAHGSRVRLDGWRRPLARLSDRVLKPLHPSIAEHLMRQIMHYDKEFRREVATSAVGSSAKHWRFGSNGARGPMRPHPHAGQAGGRWPVHAKPHSCPTAAEYPSQLSFG